MGVKEIRVHLEMLKNEGKMMEGVQKVIKDTPHDEPQGSQPWWHVPEVDMLSITGQPPVMTWGALGGGRCGVGSRGEGQTSCKPPHVMNRGVAWSVGLNQKQCIFKCITS